MNYTYLVMFRCLLINSYFRIAFVFLMYIANDQWNGSFCWRRSHQQNKGRYNILLRLFNIYMVRVQLYIHMCRSSAYTCHKPHRVNGYVSYKKDHYLYTVNLYCKSDRKPFDLTQIFYTDSSQ